MLLELAHKLFHECLVKTYTLHPPCAHLLYNDLNWRAVTEITSETHLLSIPICRHDYRHLSVARLRPVFLPGGERHLFRVQLHRCFLVKGFAFILSQPRYDALAQMSILGLRGDVFRPISLNLNGFGVSRRE